MEAKSDLFPPENIHVSAWKDLKKNETFISSDKCLRGYVYAQMTFCC
jgi:hypothetical protein